MNPIRWLTKCPPFAGYAAILASSGLHEEPGCRKRGSWHTDVYSRKGLQSAYPIKQPFNELTANLGYLTAYETS